MARTGPPPIPTHLKKLRGNPGGRPLNKREPIPKGPLIQPPADLPEDAIEHWTYAIACAPRGLLRRLDLRTLAVYSIACAKHAEAARIVKRDGVVFKKRNMKMPHIHPAMRVLDSQASVILRTCAEMGFTPASRSRIMIKEGDLIDEPDEPSNPFDEFARQ